MTLLEIANLACTTVQMGDAGALEIAKAFARFKYEKTFRENLWRDSVSLFPFLLDPTGDPTTPTGGNAALTALAVQGVYMLPPSIERVLAMRTAALDVIDWSVKDASITPAARHWEGVHPTRLFQTDLDAFTQTGEPTTFVSGPALVALLPATGAATLWALNSADAGVVARLTAIDAITNTRETVAITLTTSPQAGGPDTAREILTFSKPETQGAVCLGNEDGVEILRLAADETSAPPCVPVRMMPVPSTVTAFRALVKRRPLELTDNDTPDIRGMDDVLMEYVTGKLRELCGQVQTAQVNYQRSDAALAALLGTELLQMAENPRLVPEDGFGMGELGYAGLQAIGPRYY